ncbi:ABC transporter ATP-binding protein [Microbispora triticiradicis]|uniref:ABC transporter ATP-binding protein n=1 Tax=Microbispora triticiradicis TaxID=2200763 RepID=A0ABX9LMS0_9ACTN|nr:ABC transporter ATP-binding protein [Microbispora triticiradicis]RGA05257.1 ABC transporter ATP-binding protein [Microbispora triticiradicis]GLW22794.1 ABC transporter ATP-binding protein [Microbispora amethystogenes]
MSGDHPSAPLLEVAGLSVGFATRRGVVPAVRDVDLSLRAGECLAVVGESGSGKSVTARALLGLAGAGARVTARTLTFEGRDLRTLGGGQWRRLRGRRIGYVLQDALTSLDPLRRVGLEVAEALEVHGLARRDDLDDQVIRLLAEAGVPDPHVRFLQYPHELSGGLRQRALIASAIAAEPALLIADEPTTALDVTVQAQVLGLLEERRRRGTALLLISHDLAVVARLAGQIAVLFAGLVVERGPAAALLASPAHPYTADLLAAVPVLDGPDNPGGGPVRGLPIVRTGPAAATGCPYAPRCALADDRCRSEPPPPVSYGEDGQDGQDRMVRCFHPGRARPATASRAPAAPARVTDHAVVSVRGVTKRYRSPDGSWRTAVGDVSFDLRAGEALGLVGESGSGKSTTARIVLAEIVPDAGTVLLDGEPWSGLRERDRRPRRSRIQLVDQDPLSSFDPRFTVERVVGEAVPGRMPRRRRRERVAALLGRVGLDPALLDRVPARLSGGQRQRVAIARALAPGPEVIVCDEPVSALDVTVQAQILALLAELRREAGVALLFISHDLGVVRQVCDRVAVMKDGRLVETGAVADVFRAPRAAYTAELLAAVPRIDAGRTAGALPHAALNLEAP